jgi:hypothetical protein
LCAFEVEYSNESNSAAMEQLKAELKIEKDKVNKWLLSAQQKQ